MRKVAVIASAGGSGKTTTVGRALAEQLGLPFVELDALVHGPDWAETPTTSYATFSYRFSPWTAG